MVRASTWWFHFEYGARHAVALTPCRSAPVDPDLDLPAPEERAKALARARRSSPRRPGPQGRRALDLPTRGRPPPTAGPPKPRLGPRVQGPVPPLPDHAGPRRPPQGRRDRYGLPVELEVEKELGLHKVEIEAYGIEAFNARCRFLGAALRRGLVVADQPQRRVDRHRRRLLDDGQRLRRVRLRLVRQLWDEGLLYEGYRVTPYCAGAGPPLLARGGPGLPGRGRPVDLRALPAGGRRRPRRRSAGLDHDAVDVISNAAAAVGPTFKYVRVPSPDGGRDLILGERAPQAAHPGGAGARPLDRRRHGRGGLALPAPVRVPRVDRGQGRVAVAAADYVTDDDGSGIVHIALAFGEDDLVVGCAEDLPVLNPVDADATFDHRVTPWQALRQGRRPRDHRRPPGRGLLVAEQAYEHSYPHCWRCGTPLIYWAKTSWFVRTEERRGDLLAQNETIGWYPEHISTAAQVLARGQRRLGPVARPLLGLALPIWRRCGCGGDTCVARWPSCRSWRGASARSRPPPALRRRGHLDLPARRVRGHRPAACRRSSTPGSDSGSMLPAQAHHPFATGTCDPARACPPAFPADFICEAIDQTRGWFYSLLAVNTLARRDAVPQRRAPRAHRRRGRAARCPSPGQRHRPLADLLVVRRRRPPLVPLLGRPAMDALPGLRGGHPQVDLPDAADAVERLQLLRHVRRPRRLAASRRRPRRPCRARPLPRPRARLLGAR